MLTHSSLIFLGLFLVFIIANTGISTNIEIIDVFLINYMVLTKIACQMDILNSQEVIWDFLGLQNGTSIPCETLVKSRFYLLYINLLLVDIFDMNIRHKKRWWEDKLI